MIPETSSETEAETKTNYCETETETETKKWSRDHAGLETLTSLALSFFYSSEPMLQVEDADI